jgi:hypothetical protein
MVVIGNAIMFTAIKEQIEVERMNKVEIRLTTAQVDDIWRQVNSNNNSIEKFIDAFDYLKRDKPDAEIIIETAYGSGTLKISQIMIYDDPAGRIVFDAE